MTRELLAFGLAALLMVGPFMGFASSAFLVAEAGPRIGLIVAPPQVMIGQEFDVTVRVADEAGLDQVEVKFNGKIHTMSAQGSKEALLTFTLKAEGPGEFTLEATAIDRNKVRGRIAVMMISVKGDLG